MLARSVPKPILPSLQIDLRDYTLVQDGQRVVDGVMTAGSAVLTSATGLFLSSDIGKYIVVTGAGAAGVNLHTTIAGFANSTTITLTAAASTTVSSAPVSWGTDQTSKVQQAFDDAETADGASVITPIGRTYMTGVLTLKNHVELSGPKSGPPGQWRKSPAMHDMAATFMIVNEASPFISVPSPNAYPTHSFLSKLCFVYPNQITFASTANPVVYQPTVYSGPHVILPTIRDCTFVNSYDAIRGRGDRVLLEDLYIGAINTGIDIDNTWDALYMNNIHMWVTYLWFEENTVPYTTQPVNLDKWKYGNPNSIGLRIKKADGPFLENIFIYNFYTGVQLESSANGNSWGQVTNICLDQCRYGVLAKSVNGPGWSFNGFETFGQYLDPAYPGFAAVKAENGVIRVSDGFVHGGYGTNFFEEAGGKIYYSNIRTYDDDTAIEVKSSSKLGRMTLEKLLDFSGTDHAGIELNNLTTTQRDALSATPGLMIYNTTTAQVERYGGATPGWAAVGGGGASNFDGGAFTDPVSTSPVMDGGSFT